MCWVETVKCKRLYSSVKKYETETKMMKARNWRRRHPENPDCNEIAENTYAANKNAIVTPYIRCPYYDSMEK